MSFIQKLKKYFKNISKKLLKNALLIEQDKVSTIELNKLFKKSLIGDVNICIENEKWPKADDGTLLLPVIQIKMFDLPFVPKYLVNIKYIVIFIYPEDMEKVHGDKSGLCIRVYNDENLKLLRKPKIIKSNPKLIKFNNIIDFPSYDDLPQKILEYKELLYSNIEEAPFSCIVSDKLFGWPFWCQNSESSEYDKLIIQLTDYEHEWVYGDCPTIYIFYNIKTKIFWGTIQTY